MFGLRGNLIDEIINRISSNSKVQKIIIFGSRARGDYQKSSDIDISIVANPLLSSEEFNILKAQLDELDTIYKIDLVDTKRIDKEALLRSIEKDGVLLYNR